MVRGAGVLANVRSIIVRMLNISQIVISHLDHIFLSFLFSLARITAM